ncbi:hypothetical protein PTTG_28904 [Puccinia triticina 1-1 BBBD Race 1]|uniref:Uncharacterized protein n=1 Tax=Puccinia triticina (isolate 1-1 / race 1 (BBBD)) TaxID=630390 RepID=A0A180G8D0_PUCT1|nr:hypothetical protein PTTG_28904 [Puccinia triticina 1-1 BBBD Race 1]
MLLTKILVSLQLLHYYGISAYSVPKSPNILVKRAPMDRFFEIFTGWRSAPDLSSAREIQPGREAENIGELQAGGSDVRKGLKLADETRSEKFRPIEPTHVIEERLQSEFLDKSLEDLWIENLSEPKKREMSKIMKENFEYIRKYTNGESGEYLEGEVQDFYKSMSSRQGIMAFYTSSDEKMKKLSIDFLNQSLESLGKQLSNKDRGKVLNTIQGRLAKHIQEKTYDEQLSGLISNLIKNKKVKLHANEPDEDPILTEVQTQMLFRIRDDKFLPDGKKMKTSQGVNYLGNYEELLHQMSVAEWSLFGKLLSYRKDINKLNSEEEIRPLAEELMEILPNSEEKKAMLDAVQYVDLLDKTENLRIIPKNTLKDLSYDDHQILQDFAVAQLGHTMRIKYQ